MIMLLEPPPQYDHAYHGHVIERRLSQLEIFFLCHGPAPACSWVSKGVCHIVFPNHQKDERAIALIRQHEIGHCNGWPGNHPGAIGSRSSQEKQSRRQRALASISDCFEPYDPAKRARKSYSQIAAAVTQPLPNRLRPFRYLRLEATWRSGYAAVCKTVYPGSIPGVASSLRSRRE
jgi:hypothetical protein